MLGTAEWKASRRVRATEGVGDDELESLAVEGMLVA
jgi:hypothetical protein